MENAEFPPVIVDPWGYTLRSHHFDQIDDLPHYYVKKPESLVSTSVPKALYVGTGLSIFTRALLPAILNAKHSVHFVTCYWAASPTLDSFREALERLAAERSELADTEPLDITIGFSSWGLFQKLFHTSSSGGQIYPPGKWAKLGLPSEATLRKGNMTMTVKTLFFTPFSVMHPKYLVVDGARAWVPSCNVSWERWFEGCVEVEGQVVGQILNFHSHVWGAHTEAPDQMALSVNSNRSSKRVSMHTGGQQLSATQSLRFDGMMPVPTMFLPSPHHRNPRFKFFPFLAQSNPPMTPLNAALLTLFEKAQRNITIVTPNVTSWPAMEALLEALERGVDVEIRTCKNMMMVEQLVTAGTTTKWCLKKFIKKYKALVKRKPSDIESQSAPGNLSIHYYRPLQTRLQEEDEPVLSHFKMTMVDDDYLVLGSGNMDRASWWTSQEIGLLFYMPAFDGRKLWEGVLERRGELLFSSSE